LLFSFACSIFVLCLPPCICAETVPVLECVSDVPKVFRHMVGVGAFQCPRRHAKVFSGKERVSSRLHMPRRRGVAKCVRRHLVAKADSDRDSFKRLAESVLIERLAAPLYRMPRAQPAPAAQVRQQPAWQRDRRIALFGDLGAFRRQQHAGCQIDERPARLTLKARVADHGRAAAGVERNQDKSSNVFCLAPAIAFPYQPRRFASR
jgi:hypothetical protein